MSTLPTELRALDMDAYSRGQRRIGLVERTEQGKQRGEIFTHPVQGAIHTLDRHFAVNVAASIRYTRDHTASSDRGHKTRRISLPGMPPTAARSKGPPGVLSLESGADSEVFVVDDFVNSLKRAFLLSSSAAGAEAAAESTTECL
jgi:hypothetical protein